MKAILVFASGTTAEINAPKGPNWLQAGERYFVRVGEAYEDDLDRGSARAKLVFAERPNPEKFIPEARIFLVAL